MDAQETEALLRRFGPSSGEHVIGIDEVGRGCIAGPVYAAAVMFRTADIPHDIDDSKRLSEKRREAVFPLIHSCAHVGIGMADVAEIERHNILEAAMLAMRRAYHALPYKDGVVVVDGDRNPGIRDRELHAVTGADALVKAVGAASIIAKVVRDRIMIDLALEHPFYDWENNKGYGTPKHLSGIVTHGITVHHRRDFAPVKRAMRRARSAD